MLVRKDCGQLRVKSWEETENQGLKDVVKKALMSMGKSVFSGTGRAETDGGKREGMEPRLHGGIILQRYLQFAIFYLFFFPPFLFLVFWESC